MARPNRTPIHAGAQFGRLTVIGEPFMGGPQGRQRSFCPCRCECGVTLDVMEYRLKGGEILSCGCYRRQRQSESNTTHGDTKGGEQSTEFTSWRLMLDRCKNPHNNRYRIYGGRGISVCERWVHSFENFLADMGRKPSPNHSIDRYPNNDGNYESGNCRWATREEQARNTHANVWLTVDGVSMILDDWAKTTGIASETIAARIARGWTVDRAVKQPLDPRGRRH